MRDSEGEGRSSASTVDIAAEEVDFSGAVEDVLDSMPMPEARNVCKAYGFEAKAALRNAIGTNAEFKSEAQKEAMIAVPERRGDLAVVLATGGGRRLL